jgi:hypothetical protein
MKATLILLAMAVAILFLTCSTNPDQEEQISKPGKPVGDDTALLFEKKTYRAVGASSNADHPLAYRFDLDEAGSHDYTQWTMVDTVVTSWSEPGVYAVAVQARCAVHPNVQSAWSEAREVVVGVSDRSPEVHFATWIRGVRHPYDPATPPDTVGMFRPFAISYRASELGMPIEAYKFFLLTPVVDVHGAGQWTTDLSDTVRTFPNTGDVTLPSGVFRLAAQCRDVLGAESPVDEATFQDGVAQVVVNFDPDTRIINARSSYSLNDIPYYRYVDFEDGIPDTVPLGSWLRIAYVGMDDHRDGTACDGGSADLCMGYQVAYYLSSVHEPNVQEFSLWQPRTGVHDTDPSSPADSNSFSIGPFEYHLSVRARDEHGRPDASPPHVDIVGNFNPTMDSVVVMDHFGKRLNLSIVDTVTWNFWKGEGWPYLCECDTVDKPEAWCYGVNDPVECQFKPFPNNVGTLDYYKSFSVRIKAWGHDDPRDPDGSGVKAWRYLVSYRSGQFINLGKSQVGWFDGGQLDVLDDVIRWKVFYPGPFTSNPDPTGDTVFENLPAWLNQDLLFFLTGKDMGTNPPPYQQYVFINGQPELINQFSAYLGRIGRRTQQRILAFQIRLIRP